MCFHGTLIKGGGGLDECYIISGVCSITLYGGGGCQKWTFCYIICGWPLLSVVVIN